MEEKVWLLGDNDIEKNNDDANKIIFIFLLSSKIICMLVDGYIKGLNWDLLKGQITQKPCCVQISAVP